MVHHRGLLFDAAALLAEQQTHNVKLGVFSSVTNARAGAEIYPAATCRTLILTTEQRQQL